MPDDFCQQEMETQCEGWLNDASASLRNQAKWRLLRYPGINTLQPTAIVNEAVARVWKSGLFQSTTERNVIMRAISQAMGDFLVDYHRSRIASKRGSGKRPDPLDSQSVSTPAQVETVVDIQDAIERLRTDHPRQADIVEMKVFGRFSTKEIADGLRVSVSTVEADWHEARGRLYAILSSYRGG